jgi:hypothetical protein
VKAEVVFFYRSREDEMGTREVLINTIGGSMIHKFLVWSYDRSLAGLVKPNASSDAKVGYVVGSNIAALVLAGVALVAMNGMLRSK